jgi:LacI family transcriptional regulator
MGNKVTLKQIAQEVGLSPSSVSLVLNNRPCRISEENRKLIKEVAARNHYVPNQIARSLVMRESRTLGLIVPNIESRFFASLAAWKSAAARTATRSLLPARAEAPMTILSCCASW